ncbi:hypothetical protein F7725_024249 [Dissostichus mawsoni]|uniref:Uncharacterized protein n=1 Tax=Dissostichus mawsoni TaxID=36200 RepID=A0A7J5Y1R3_DISMA|nr:hypothetical protein F7725_024249 [Dissostichus mawsoni]
MDRGGEEGCAGPESSTALPPPPEGDSGVVGGVLSTELLPLLGNSCSLSFSICSSEASSSGPASCSALGSSRHGGAGGGGELAASVSESENNSLRVFFGHWAWMLDQTSFWPLERTAGRSSAFPDTLALFSGISQKPAWRPALVFSFIPLYFLEGEPLVFGRLRSLSSALDSECAAPSSSELLLDKPPLSPRGPLQATSRHSLYSGSSLWIGLLGSSPLHRQISFSCCSPLPPTRPDFSASRHPLDQLHPGSSLRQRKVWMLQEGRPSTLILDWRLLSPFVLTLVHLGKDILAQATFGAREAVSTAASPIPHLHLHPRGVTLKLLPFLPLLTAVIPARKTVQHFPDPRLPRRAPPTSARPDSTTCC